MRLQWNSFCSLSHIHDTIGGELTALCYHAGNLCMWCFFRWKMHYHSINYCSKCEIVMLLSFNSDSCLIVAPLVSGIIYQMCKQHRKYAVSVENSPYTFNSVFVGTELWLFPSQIYVHISYRNKGRLYNIWEKRIF